MHMIAVPLRRVATAAILLLLLPGILGGPLAAWADGDPKPEEVADRVLAALEGSDAEAFAALAARDDPDPWLVAERLLALERFDAALAYAEAAPRAATQGLADYVRGRKGRSTPAAHREALADALAAIQGGRWADMLAALEGVPIHDVSAVTAQVLFARGIAQFQLGRMVEARRTLDQARVMAKRIGWLNVESYALNWAANAALRLRERLRAIDYARDRIDLETRWGRAKELRVGYRDLARALQASGRGDEARTALEKALALARAADDVGDQVAMYVMLGTAALQEGDYPAMLAYAQDAYATAKRANDTAAEVSGLVALGSAQGAMGEQAQARAYLRRAVALAEAGGYEGMRAVALAHLGTAESALGHYAVALRHFRDARAIMQARRMRVHMPVLLNQLAVLQDRLGNGEEARTLLETALGMFAERGDVVSIGSVATSLAQLAIRDGAFDTATKMLATALEAHRSVDNRHGEASVLASMGTLAVRRGAPEEAVRHYEDALAIMRTLRDVRGEAMTMANLGSALASLGRPQDALERIDAALELATARRHVAVAVDVRTLRARVLLAQGRSGEAAREVETAIERSELLLRGLADAEGIRARERLDESYQLGITAAVRLGDAGRTLRFLEWSRAGMLLEALGGRDVLGWSELPAPLLEAERTARRRQAQAAEDLRRADRLGDRDRARAARTAYDEATEALARAIRDIQREQKAQADLFYPVPATGDDLRDTLRPGEVLVCLGLSLDGLVAVVVTPDALRLVPLGDAEALETITAACRELQAPTPERDVTKAVATLREALAKPLALPKDVTHVHVSPYGLLGHVPLGLVLQRPVSVVPSATALRQLRRVRTEPGEGVLALGNPTYGNARVADAGPVARGFHLVPLPATRLEVEAVGTVRLLGAGASETALRKAVTTRPRWRALHLACHGHVDRARPALSALALTPTHEDDGFLTALEVFRMDLPVDLAVLSACESGDGADSYSEGLLGLARAFMHAGAPRILASLWRVDDEATRAFMVAFYDAWQGTPERPGVSTAEALIKAQAHVRAQERWAHPYYWAAWVLWGLPESPGG